LGEKMTNKPPVKIGVKSLYWKNLIKKDSTGKNLVWRCELLKLVGRNIMGY